MESRLRLRRVAGGFGLLLAAGIVYALWVERTGLAFPCAFRTLTHLMCTNVFNPPNKLMKGTLLHPFYRKGS